VILRGERVIELSLVESSSNSHKESVPKRPLLLLWEVVIAGSYEVLLIEAYLESIANNQLTVEPLLNIDRCPEQLSERIDGKPDAKQGRESFMDRFKYHI